jgi:hypothetical protein
MGYMTAFCALNISAADLEKVIPPLCALCYDKQTKALALVENPPKSFEQVLLEQIGRYSGDGTYIEMTDDKGTPFRWLFVNGRAKKVEPIILWPELAAQ